MIGTSDSPRVATESLDRLPLVRRGLAGLWAARGLWGGLIAIGLGWRAQDLFMHGGDVALAGRLYWVAIVLVIAALVHPRLPWRRQADASVEPNPAAAAPVVARPIPPESPPAPRPAAANGAAHAADAATATASARLPGVRPWLPSGAPAKGRRNGQAPLPARPAAPPAQAAAVAAPIAGQATVPVRRVGAPRSAPPAVTAPPTVAPVATPVAAEAAFAAARLSPWARWVGIRTRLGRRVTVPGLVLALALAGASAGVLIGNVASPLGGWLWAAALVVLVLTFTGAGRWPRNAGGLLPAARDDFFGPGVPRIPLRWEITLAGCMMALALALRVWNLEYMPGIFGDEGERGMDARGIIEGQPANLFGYGWWGVPNLYFYILSWMLRFFGDNMFGDRMLSVISGLVIVWFAYRIGRMLWGPRAGLLAGGLMAVSPLALQFSRWAGESSPTGALWIVGFYFLLRALRERQWSDWVWAGLATGFSLYFYAAGKLIIPLLGVTGLYCLIRWRLAFFKRYALGFALSALVFGLVFLPYALFLNTDHWQGFFGRAQETSIFSPQNAVQTFARYGIPYNAAWGALPLTQNLLAHPLPWAQVLFNQARVASEVLYRVGDAAEYYKIPFHAGSLLSPLLAVLTLLGLGYATWKLWDPRYGLPLLWFWGGMLGMILTIDDPNVQRLDGAWPFVMLFPAAFLDRIWAAAWPVSRPLARRWATVPLAALLIFAGADGYQEYFIQYASTCPYCTPTTQARYAQALGQEYKAYQLGVADYAIYFNYGSTRFAAKGVEGDDGNVPVDFLPITDNGGKGAAFIVYPSNADYLPLIRQFYPGGLEQVITGTNGTAIFTSYKLTRQQMAASQSLHVTYTGADGKQVTRAEAGLGTGSDPASGQPPWTPPPGLAYPATAVWQGGLVAPGYGLYTLSLAGPAGAQLAIDGRVVLQGGAGGSPDGTQATLVLARGTHDVRLTGTLADARTSLVVHWGAAGSALLPVAPQYLFSGSTGGLSASAGPGSAAHLADADPFGGAVPQQRRSDPAIGFQEGSVDFGHGPLLIRWQGTLHASVAGTYQFQLRANGPTAMLIDGQPLGPAGAAGGAGTATLAAGDHAVDVRYFWQSGPMRVMWLWTPPGGAPGIVPPQVLSPLARSWPRGTIPDPQTGQPDLHPVTAPPAPLAPSSVFGGDSGMTEPRGLTVAPNGDVYVADTGNNRILHFDAHGKAQPAWGDAKTPGFAMLGDLAVAPSGQIVALDSKSGDLSIFGPDGTLVRRLPAVAAQGNGIAVGPDGRIWIAHTGGNRVVVLQPDGSKPRTITGGADGTRARFEQPVDVAVAPDGTVYVIDLKGRIAQLDAAGQVVQEWPVQIGIARGGSRLAVWQGQVVMSDPDRGRLVVLDPASGQERLVGGQGTDPGQFQLPLGIAAGADGQLYVLDSDNHRVQVFKDLGGK